MYINILEPIQLAIKPWEILLKHYYKLPWVYCKNRNTVTRYNLYFLVQSCVIIAKQSCQKGEVVVIDEVWFGRMELGTCMIRSFGYIDCCK